MDTPSGRRTRPLSDSEHFRASFRVPQESRIPGKSLIPKGYEAMEARFYDHARKNGHRRRSNIIKVIGRD